MTGDTTGMVLGTATAGVVLPATASSITGINYFYCLAVFAITIILYNLVIKLVTRLVK